MIVYNPHDEVILKNRLKAAKELLEEIPSKYVFITGSFLYKEKYNDIDVFVISRSKKEFNVSNEKAKITVMDFNDLHSLFYHSIAKSSVANDLLPKKPLKVTIADFWGVVNEAVPTLLNDKDKYHKNVRFLVLYTEYFLNGQILDTVQLNRKIESFKDYLDLLKYINENVPLAIQKNTTPSYIKRFFYTQAGFYKASEYEAQRFLYDLTHQITAYG